MTNCAKERRKKLAILLTTIMFLAMLLGPGPGLRFINPDINDADPRYLFCGIPIVYAWGLFWYAIQVAIVLVAYVKLWKPNDDETAAQPTQGET